MSTAIDIQSATRAFGRGTRLGPWSFAVPERSITGLLGRNGAGKTTIMSMIAGQDRPTSGHVEVLGHAPFEHAPTLRQLSYVRDNQRYPDDYRLHHVLRIAPEFAPNWSHDLAGELVEGLRIPATTPIKKLSRGQHSAVAVVLGLASRAAVTLLDEPCLGLDVSARSLFYEALLRDHAAHPRTVLMSTHLVEESENLFDRVVLIDRDTVIVDCGIDHARDLACLVSGVAAQVERVTAGRRVLAAHSVGALRSVTLAGPIDDDLSAAARQLGLQVSAASLHDLVSAYGAGEPGDSALAMGVPA